MFRLKLALEFSMISDNLGVPQDIVTRYATGTGHHCPRRFGWDCHGLPVEYEIDKKLGRLLCFVLHPL